MITHPKPKTIKEATETLLALSDQMTTLFDDLPEEEKKKCCALQWRYYPPLASWICSIAVVLQMV